MGQSALRDGRIPFRITVGDATRVAMRDTPASYRKGIGSISPNLVAEIAPASCGGPCGNANESADDGWGPGKSCLFFVRVTIHGSDLVGDMDVSVYP